MRSTENVRYPSGGSGAARASFDALVDVARARPQDVPRAHPATSRVRDAAPRATVERTTRGSRARLAAATALASDMAPLSRWARSEGRRRRRLAAALSRARDVDDGRGASYARANENEERAAIVASHAAAPIARECAGRRR